ncbi:MAG: FtsH protease activity modulator HflK [Gammaproteobacteria bacterium]
MAWNEPDKDDKNRDEKDPWGQRNKGDAPPDLDEVIRNMQDKISGIFGGKKSGGSSSGGKDDGGNSGNAGFLGMIGIIALVYAAFNSVHIIDEPERGVVLRFGKYVTTLNPGLNIRFPKPIEEVYRVNVNKINSVKHHATMLTNDENIVDVELAVQYKIKDVKNYLFNVKGPDATLLQATESSIRNVIGHSDMDFILTRGRGAIADDTQQLIQDTLDQYKSGIIVTSVNMLPAKPPEQVKDAFDDVKKASEDKERLINQAQAYQNEIIPKSRGKAARLTEDALAYEARVVAQAEGQASRFEQLLTEYKKAPVVTRERLYLESVESVLSQNRKIFLDTGAGDKILYLPIGQGTEGQMPSPVLPSSTPSGSRSTSDSVDQRMKNQDDLRSRSKR